MDAAARTRFIDAWGQMGSLWGINTSCARIHALLMASDEPVSLDAIATTLGISRGNASMSLKDLRSWGVVRQHKEPGDRRDYYLSEPDVWKMFFLIAKERKRRELDPAVSASRELLTQLGEDEQGPAAARMRQLSELLSTMSGMADKVLANPESAKMMMSLLG